MIEEFCVVCGDKIFKEFSFYDGNYYCTKSECLQVKKEVGRMERWLRGGKAMANGRCIFEFGGCDKPAGPSGFCIEHEGKACYRCGKQAITETGSQINAVWLTRLACEDHISYI
jgi:hypothetical protein